MSNVNFKDKGILKKRTHPLLAAYLVVRKIFYPLIKLFLKLTFWWPLSFSTYRGMIFDSAPSNNFILSCSGNEAYILQTSDMVISRSIYKNKEFDFSKFSAAIDILGPEGPRHTLIDVGANIGSVCIPAIKRGIFNNAIAVEPEPLNFNLLSANIHINGLSEKITPLNLALGDVENGEVDLELCKDNSGDHRIKLSNDDGIWGERNRNVIKVKSNTLDEIFKNQDLSDVLIWMDTQGYEGFVLKGGTKILKNRMPLVLEFWPYGMLRCGSYEVFKKSLQQGGYQLFYDLDCSEPTSKQLCTSELDSLWEQIGTKGNSTDILVV